MAETMEGFLIFAISFGLGFLAGWNTIGWHMK